MRDRLLDESVDSVIGRSPAVVRQWFEEQRVLDLDLDRNCPRTWADVAEIFERRHTIVHSGAEVTARYASLVTDSPAVGTSLRITDMYMEQALGDLLGLGVSLATEVLAKLYPSDSLLPVVTAMGLVRPLQHWGDRSTDPWPLLEVLVGAVNRAAAAASGPDAEGVRAVGRLMSLWWAWNSEGVHEGVPPKETFQGWEPGPSVVEQFAVAVLAEDEEKALALADSAAEHPDFALLVLLPRVVKDPIREAAARLTTTER